MKWFLYIIILIESVIWNINYANAQNIIVRAHPDTNKIKIGEHFNIELMAKGPIGSKFIFPTYSDTINEHFDIISQSKYDTLFNEDKSEITIKQKWRVTSFDSGYWAISPLKFYILPDTAKFFETEAFLMQVNTVEVDTTKEVKDIKQPYSAPISWQEWLPYALGTFGLIGLLIFIIWYIKQKRNQPAKLPEPIAINPGEKALNLLQELERKKLWQNGFNKDYYTELTDILRNYFDEKYFTKTNEQVSDEIMISMRTYLNQINLNQLKQILWLADMVKFAKEQPVASENELAYKNAYEIISVTSVLIEKELND
jgi:hypothetical protein